MPRRQRGWIDHACYHITHHCHGREFLFRFSKYRDIYIKQLSETRRRFKVDILNYIVTSNHVHLLISAPAGKSISSALQFLHGSVGQQYNILKKREGAFWKGRFHATCIQSGDHLARCSFYIDLNMVRAGVVEHPSQWKHSGYHEILEGRQRYRIINENRLLEVFDAHDIASLRNWYKQTIDEKIKEGDLARREYWSKSVAVGDEDWLENISRSIGMKRFKIHNAIPNDLQSDFCVGRCQNP